MVNFIMGDGCAETWSWLGGAQGQPAYMKGWISAVPQGSLILLDLMAEESPLWKRSESYYGAPFIWCLRHNIYNVYNIIYYYIPPYCVYRTCCMQ
jgi:hypothetical protein